MGLSKDDVTQQIEETIMEAQGKEEGQAWLNHALDELKKLEDDWDFKTVEILGGEDSLLLKVEDTVIEESAVVKIPQDSRTGCAEAAALKIWEDCNVPAVKNENTETGAFMMDYVPPTDKDVSPFQAFVLADVLHTPAMNFDYNFPSLEENISQRIARAFSSYDLREETADFWLAVNTVEKLLSTQDHEELLHGDYRNKNIIYAESGPVIIAPQPCMGDSLFDIALWLSESHNLEDIAVVLQLTGAAGERLIPWIWSLAVLNNLSTPAIETYKDQVMGWLDKQGQNPSGIIEIIE